MNRKEPLMNNFEYDGRNYRKTDSGYCYCDGKRISREEFENKENEMNKSACNVIELNGHEYINDHCSRKYYKDGEEISRAKFKKELGINSGKRGSTTKRRSKDVALEVEGVTLTAKQLDFMRHLDDSDYCNVKTGVWVDFLQEEIGGQFADKPMTVGAMISTLREKGIIEVRRETRSDGNSVGVKCRSIHLTELGWKVFEAAFEA